MCKIASPPTVKRINENAPNMLVPAVTRYHYSRDTLVHPFTHIRVSDHVFCFKTEVEHEEGKIIIVCDEGNIYGYKITEIFTVIDEWYRQRNITNDEHAEMSTYFEGFINNDMPVSSKDQITNLTRFYTLNQLNWLLQYVNRVDLRGMIPPAWFYAKRAENMHVYNQIIRENADPVFRAPSPHSVMQDVSNFDLFSMSSIDFSDNDDDDVIVLEQDEEAVVYRVD